jgi:hypothetical protein
MTEGEKDSLRISWAMVTLAATATGYGLIIFFKGGALVQAHENLVQHTDQMETQFSAEHLAILSQLADLRATNAAMAEQQKAQDRRLEMLEDRMRK